MNNKKFMDKLRAWNACKDAIEWLGERTEAEALRDCERGDWLLWWFFRERNTPGYPDIKQITKVKVECAKLVQHLMTDERSKNALEVAERWANGEATDEELNAAADAAVYAAADADVYASVSVYADASVSVYAATAAAAAATATAAAADATAAFTADAAERKKTLQTCADICRKHFFVP